LTFGLSSRPPASICLNISEKVIPKRLAPVVEAGTMRAKLVPDWENPARGLYFEHPQRQRDEAIRTGAIGAIISKTSNLRRLRCQELQL
jgi:hypothetical protein